jgi:RNA polymerase sigma-70 factor (ECF subfamily)
MTDLAATSPSGAPSELEQRLGEHRAELTGYCYRMLGSAFEAEDAVQETLTRAWRAHDGFEGRSSLRSWLYRIATNVCYDALRGRQRRARPMDLSAPGTADGPLGAPRAEVTWIEPVPDERILPGAGNPADVAVARDSIRLAFMAALQHLPPRQRAVLILREVVHLHTREVADLLDTTEASVNSALQRARATLASRDLTTGVTAEGMDADDRALLDRYVDAFQRYDIDRLTSLLAADASMSMPPYALWLRGRDQMLAWFFGPGAECRGSRLLATTANGSPAFGQYRPSGPGGSFEPWSLQVVEIVGDQIVEITFFLDAANLFPIFGLPLRLDR